MNIGIFGNPVDKQIENVKKYLIDKGAKVKIFNLTKSKIEFRDTRIICDDVDILKYDTFYIRQIGYGIPKFLIQTNISEWVSHYNDYLEYIIAEKEKMVMKLTLIKILSDTKFVVNPYESQFYQLLKIYQSYLLSKYGLPIPDWFCTNVCEPIYDYNNTKLIHKPLTSGQLVDIVNKDWLTQWTGTPLIFQNYIDGTPLRAIMIGDEIVGCCEIIRKNKKVDVRNTPIKLHRVSLPADVKEKIIYGGKILGLYFSAVDMMKRNNEYYILEYNPSPQFYFMERDAKIHISEKLAEFLINKK